MKQILPIMVSASVGSSVGTAVLLIMLGGPAPYGYAGPPGTVQFDLTSIVILGSGFSVVAVAACGLSQVLNKFLSEFETLVAACLYGGALPVSTVLLINTRQAVSTAGGCPHSAAGFLKVLSILVLSSASCAVVAAVIRERIPS